MERELWPRLYHTIRTVGSRFHQRRVQYQPWVIVLVLAWAALHDRPLSWACQPRNWGTTKLRLLQVPSASTISRRARSAGVALLLRELEVALRNTSWRGLIARLDGKPLPVGGFTKDRTARYGRGVGMMAKGYKLHAVWAGRALPEAWDVTPLNVSETTVAKELVKQLHHGGYLLADGGYDGSPLYDAAFAENCQLVTPVDSPQAGQGHHYQSPHRLRSIELMQGEFGQALFAQRSQIERDFGNATSFGGGLATLPAWARTLPRVRNWVWIKLLVNATRILRHQHLAT